MADGRSQPTAHGMRTALPRSPVLRRVLLVEENVVVAQRRHWASVAEPAATALVGFLVAGFLFDVVERTYHRDVGLLWLLGLVPLVRAVWRLLEWHRHWFVATDKRLLMTTGVVNQKVGMMPLGKVTDMSYTRSLAGQVLRYGRFVLESAGQDQAMRTIDFVVHPDDTYRRICDTLFGSGPDRAQPGGPGGTGPTAAATAPPAVPPSAPLPRPFLSDGETREIPTRRPF